MAKKTLRRWTQIGLFTEDDEVVRFSSDLKYKYSQKLFELSEFTDDLRQLIFAERNNLRFWENEKNQSADMCRLTAWMLAQDVYRFRPSNFSDADDLYVSQIDMPDVIRQFTNSTRWNGFTSWGAFLGFGQTETGKAAGEFILDPTASIRRSVHNVLSNRSETPMNQFVKELSEIVPVLDGGVYRLEVESRLKVEKWQRPGQNEVSTSLSRAFLRLRESGEIRFESRSDASGHMALIGRNGRVLESVTHVRLGVAK
ncbi:MAG: hypothetical protein KF851_12050 [Pirellulaceae bacterium]|nr:hypothetical protein [Pirellulaceae bacterium]